MGKILDDCLVKEEKIAGQTVPKDLETKQKQKKPEHQCVANSVYGESAWQLKANIGGTHVSPSDVMTQVLECWFTKPWQGLNILFIQERTGHAQCV